MPIYGYRCEKCGNELEVLQSFSEERLTECPKCGGRLAKKLYPAGVIYKGTGYYKTDYSSTSSSKRSSEKSERSFESKSDGSSESKSDGSSESKSDSGKSDSSSGSSSGSSSDGPKAAAS